MKFELSGPARLSHQFLLLRAAPARPASVAATRPAATSGNVRWLGDGLSGILLRDYMSISLEFRTYAEDRILFAARGPRPGAPGIRGLPIRLRTADCGPRTADCVSQIVSVRARATTCQRSSA